jgi:hypothetical protein
MGRDSDASGGSANGGNGEGNGNEGRGGGDGGGSGDGGNTGVGNRTASRGGMAAENARGGLGSMGGAARGEGGFGGMGMGNPASYGAKSNPAGYEKSVDVQAQRDNLNMAGKATRGLGAVVGAPVAAAGHVMSAVAKYGRVEGELSDMERAARANGMGDTQRGDGSAMAKALAGNLNLKDPAQKALHDSIIPPAPTGPTPTKTGAQLREYARA